MPVRRLESNGSCSMLEATEKRWKRMHDPAVARVLFLSIIFLDILGAAAVEKTRLMRRERKAHHELRHAREVLDLGALGLTSSSSSIILSPTINPVMALATNSRVNTSRKDRSVKSTNFVNAVKRQPSTPSLIPPGFKSSRTSEATPAVFSHALLMNYSTLTQNVAWRHSKQIVIGSKGIDTIAPSLMWLGEHSKLLGAQTPPPAALPPATVLVTPAPATGAPATAPAAPTVAPVAPVAPAAASAPAAAPAPVTEGDTGGGGLFYLLLLLLLLSAVGAGAYYAHKKIKARRTGRALDNAIPNADDTHFWRTAKSRQSYRKANLESGTSGAESDDVAAAQTSRSDHGSKDASNSETEGRNASISGSYRDRRRASVSKQSVPGSRVSRSTSATRGGSEKRGHSRDVGDELPRSSSVSDKYDRPSSRRLRKEQSEPKEDELVV
eukprot:CAMPEP_0169192386 /NCGR_PEP_ID=MMETSP1016-20121227/5583_1 /TAXON_ID=342587 /ORGANISM="Karlodinium micrum, Strain CCMP2283" /LENGTH=439 /DNA_ID=CAMNT_0009268715 /DNA_START=24 /DNA_END=1343 /DNA_ORIENTATION=+